MTYILVSIETKPSKINDSDIFIITWLDETTLEKYETIIDTSYKNYKRNGWYDIVHSQMPFGRYTGLKPALRKTQKGKKVLDADSVPRKLESLTEDDIINIIVSKKNNDGRNNFKDLFDVN